MNSLNTHSSDELLTRGLEQNLYEVQQFSQIANPSNLEVNRNPPLPSCSTSHDAQITVVRPTVYPNLTLSNTYGQFHATGYSPAYPTLPTYNFARTSYDRFGQNSYRGARSSSYYEKSVQIHEEQEYTVTALDEKFKVYMRIANKGKDRRVRYTREEIQNITISVIQSAKRPTSLELKDSSEMMVVRRPLEGCSPIFDRDEIIFHTDDKRQDRYYELKERDGRSRLKYEDLENYEITRSTFKKYSGPRMPPSGFDLVNKNPMEIEVPDSNPNSETGSDVAAQMSPNSSSDQKTSCETENFSLTERSNNKKSLFGQNETSADDKNNGEMSHQYQKKSLEYNQTFHYNINFFNAKSKLPECGENQKIASCNSSAQNHNVSQIQSNDVSSHYVHCQPSVHKFDKSAMSVNKTFEYSYAKNHPHNYLKPSLYIQNESVVCDNKETFSGNKKISEKSEINCPITISHGHKKCTSTNEPFNHLHQNDLGYDNSIKHDNGQWLMHSSKSSTRYSPKRSLKHSSKKSRQSPEQSKYSNRRSLTCSPKRSRFSPKSSRFSPKSSRFSPKSSRFSPKSSRFSPKRSKYSPKRSRYSHKRSKYSPKRSRYSLERPRYSLERSSRGSPERSSRDSPERSSRGSPERSSKFRRRASPGYSSKRSFEFNSERSSRYSPKRSSKRNSRSSSRPSLDRSRRSYSSIKHMESPTRCSPESLSRHDFERSPKHVDEWVSRSSSERAFFKLNSEMSPRYIYEGSSDDSHEILFRCSQERSLGYDNMFRSNSVFTPERFGDHSSELPPHHDSVFDLQDNSLENDIHYEGPPNELEIMNAMQFSPQFDNFNHPPLRRSHQWPSRGISYKRKPWKRASGFGYYGRARSHLRGKAARGSFGSRRLTRRPTYARGRGRFSTRGKTSF